ncbi:MAG: response regulator transcription factor [Cytophagales bacterium]|nr:response regulator transcription factor [Cytophagales bacterium]
MHKWTVYIADDQTLFRQGMSRLVSTFKNVAEVKVASNGKELLDLVNKKPPDAVLMDLEMPIMNGIEATEKVLAKYPDVKIVGLSMHDSHQHIYYFLETGAHGFLLKNADPEEVEAAITSAIEKDFYNNQLTADALRKGTLDRKKAEGRPIFQSNITLSDREKEVLLLICRELTMREISERLSLSEKTIHNHRARIMSKVGVHNTVGLVKYAYSIGML